MTTYSHSRLSTFENCRYKYKLQYIDKIKVDVPTTIEAFMGDMVHQTLEKLYSDLKFAKLNSLAELLDFFNTIWDKEWSDSIIINKKEFTSNNYKIMGTKFISDYYNHYKPFNQMTILGLETEDRMGLSNGSTYHVRIDKLACIGNTYYVCDYKTNASMKSQEDVDSDRQLAMYSIWVRSHFKDAKKVVLLWHMLAFDKEITSTRSKKELVALEKETVALINTIENCTDFPTNVTGLCNYCVYKAICPSFKHSVEIATKTVREFKDDDGVKLVDEYSVLQTKKKEIEDTIEKIREDLVGFATSKKIDVVYGSNMKLSVKEYSKINYEENKDEVIKLLKDKGLFENMSMLNYSRFNSLIIKGELKEFNDLVKIEKDFRMSLSKRKDGEE